jgi:hypothetical protein
MDSTDSNLLINRKDFEEKILKEVENSKISDIGPSALTILKDLNFHHMHFTPFVNGYYYIYMQNGTWIDYFNGSDNNLEKLLGVNTDQLKDISRESGSLIFNTDLPNILMETESVSGRLRNLSYATKMQINGDFSINFHDTSNLKMMKYHIAWLKFIEALRRGDIALQKNDQPTEVTNSFMPIPYYNAMWVLVFKPFSVQPMAIFKLMGITPVNAPIQQLLGDRGSPTLGTFNQTYKCNDVVFDIRYLDDQETQLTYTAPNTGSDSVYSKLLKEFNELFKNRNTQTTKEKKYTNYQ